jgi:nucleotide-binding universal stress UspA family protein
VIAQCQGRPARGGSRRASEAEALRHGRELKSILLHLDAAPLLVMGCRGHGRARAWALGGVTRTVLRSMTLPVLMTQ